MINSYVKVRYSQLNHQTAKDTCSFV